MDFRYRFVFGCIATLFLLSCEAEKKELSALQQQIDNIKNEFAPDKRVALFSVETIENNQGLILKGESNLLEAVSNLRETLSAGKIDFIDSIQILPSKKFEHTKGIINISVANLRSKPSHSAELATQATLGTVVEILKQDGEWYYIQTPDKYLSWIDHGGIQLKDKEQIDKWKSGPKIIFTKTYGHSYTGPEAKEVVSDLVAGSILQILKNEANGYIVSYPDGRRAFVSKAESQEYSEWLNTLNFDGESLLTVSKTLMGVPYLWGGTSTKGVDCSGFTKTIYFMNGLVIPRDASQQVHTGKLIDSTKNFETLQKGDLLFFGRKATDTTKEKVVHVGMWIGNNEFIHSSGKVHISSMDPAADNFDEYNLNRYLRTKRIFEEKDSNLLSLKQHFIFK